MRVGVWERPLYSGLSDFVIRFGPSKFTLLLLRFFLLLFLEHNLEDFLVLKRKVVKKMKVLICINGEYMYIQVKVGVGVGGKRGASRRVLFPYSLRIEQI